MEQENNKKLILGIEPSFDNISCSVAEIDINDKKYIKYIDHKEYNQIIEHEEYKGVVPEKSSRSMLDKLPILIKSLKSHLDNIDIVAATIGPGLIGNLIISYHAATTLALSLNAIYIPIHHLEAHFLVSLEEFPYIVVLISGAHTQIVACYDFNKYITIANTIDDAIGEVFDKVGRKLNLPYPYGPFIETIAKDIKCPIKIKTDTLNISSIKHKLINLKEEPSVIASYLQILIAKLLESHINEAIKKTNITKVIFAGGVSSNKYLREYFSRYIFLKKEQCTDNGDLVCAAAKYHYENNTNKVNNYKLIPFAKMKLEDYSNK